MKDMMIFLRVMPLILLVMTQVIALVGMPGEAAAHGVAPSAYTLPRLMYAAGVLGGAACLVLGVLSRTPREGVLHVMTSPPVLVIAAVVTIVAVIAGPLLWGRVIDEFHLTHHLVRAMLLAVVFMFYWWYVAADR